MIMVVTAVFLGAIVAGLSILDIYLLKQCFGQRREQDEDGEQPAQFPPLTVPYFAFARWTLHARHFLMWRFQR